MQNSDLGRSAHFTRIAAATLVVMYCLSTPVISSLSQPLTHFLTSSTDVVVERYAVAPTIGSIRGAEENIPESLLSKEDLEEEFFNRRPDRNHIILYFSSSDEQKSEKQMSSTTSQWVNFAAQVKRLNLPTDVALVNCHIDDSLCFDLGITQVPLIRWYSAKSSIMRDFGHSIPSLSSDYLEFAQSMISITSNRNSPDDDSPIDDFISDIYDYREESRNPVERDPNGFSAEPVHRFTQYDDDWPGAELTKLVKKLEMFAFEDDDELRDGYSSPRNLDAEN